MSKRPTPKKQQSHAQTSRRFKTFQNNVRKRLTADANISECPKCHESKLPHHACPTCGSYNNRTVVDREKKMNKITKVKA